jgi:hypothetical protein
MALDPGLRHPNHGPFHGLIHGPFHGSCPVPA